MTTTYSKIHLALAKHLKINPEWLSDQTYGTEKDQVFHFVYSEKQDCDEGEVQTFAHLFDVWEVDDQDGEARFFYAGTFCYDAGRKEVENVDLQETVYPRKDEDMRFSLNDD
jgi:hypothetical protein